MDEIIFVQTFSLLCKFVSTNTDRTNAIAQETNGITLETKMKEITDAKTDHCALYLGLKGHSFFISLLLNINCGYSLKPLQGGGSNMYQQ